MLPVVFHRPESSQQSDKAGYLLSRHFQVESTGRWKEFEAALPRVACGVVYSESSHEESFHRFITTALRSPLKPLALITRFDTANEKHLKRVRKNSVVWESEMAADLVPVVARECSLHMFQVIEDAFRRNEAVPLELLKAMRLALAGPNVVLHQKELLRVLRCDRSTLSRQWNHFMAGGRVHPTLKTFLDWVVLLRAMDSKNPGVTWGDIAEKLDLPFRTLTRISQRLVGTTIGALESSDHRDTVRRLLDEVAGLVGDRL